jgi:hypothetical protein
VTVALVLAVGFTATGGGASADARIGVAPAPGHGLQTGFLDGDFSDPDPSVRTSWLNRALQARGSIVRLQLRWSAVEPSRIAGTAAEQADNPALHFEELDAAVRDASARGLRVLLTVSSAPRWAEGPQRPTSAPPGSWRPDPAALRAFSTAAARRYSGRFADPQRPGSTLPAVRLWQAWNEPNLSRELTPQWTEQSGRFVAAGPSLYRAMLNAVYDAVRSVSPDNVVLSAGTAPFGDSSPGGPRTPPVRFWRELLCLTGRHLTARACGRPAHFDVLAHHPYSVGDPGRRALNAEDVSIPDLGKLTRLLRRAQRVGGVLPRRHQRVWVTEIGYDSSPPDPQGVPVALHARFVADTLYRLWSQGADVVVWLNIRDEAPLPSFAATSQSGLYFRDGSAKPALSAFRFPFLTRRLGSRRLLSWGRAPGRGIVVIERAGRRGWRTVGRARTGPSGVFQDVLAVRATAVLRARLGSEVSRPWGPAQGR